ncbi:hypothetical protein [Sphingobacterium sp. HMA12]|uniref:hypothetical protein n=1 Tax=Sphingobacterium sp. HMA12 TaxID=2050894 RepID=UPI001F277362|nr:hypothetical protein [Sphingobacterium sp. HMA12]
MSKINVSITIIFFFLIRTASGQANKEFAVGYADSYDNLPTIHFKTVTEKDYKKASAVNQLTRPIPTIDRNNIIIPTGNGKVKLQKYDDSPNQLDGFRGWQYKGYFPVLKCYALVSHSVSEHLDFSDMVLIDSNSAVKNIIISVGDAAVELPVPSPNGRFVAYYYNYDYERNSCFIGLLKVQDGGDQKKCRLSELMSFQTKDWAVDDIRWLDDNSFIVKAYTMQGQGDQKKKQFIYYLTKLHTVVKQND